MNRIKDLRERNHESQNELAKIIGVSKATMSKYENGLVQMSDDTMKVLAHHFNCSIDYLLGYESSATIDKDSYIKNIYILRQVGIDENLSDESIKKIAEYVNFIKQQEKNKKK